MKNIKAVVFDLDGTLLDTLTDLTISVNAACEARGFPVHTKDEVCSFVGNGVYKLIERAIPDGTRNDRFEETLEYFKSHYAEHSVRAMTAVLGVDPQDEMWAEGASTSDGAMAALDVLVDAELQRRTTARASQDWATADAVRDRLIAAGIDVTDTPDGPQWSLKKD